MGCIQQYYLSSSHLQVRYAEDIRGILPPLSIHDIAIASSLIQRQTLIVFKRNML